MECFKTILGKNNTSALFDHKSKIMKKHVFDIEFNGV